MTAYTLPRGFICSSLAPGRMLISFRSQIVQFAQDWIGTHITPAVENPHSLATEAAKRAEEQERVRPLIRLL
jgi:hypothetical protein